MFPRSYFAGSAFAPTYFPGGALVLPPTGPVFGLGNSGGFPVGLDRIRQRRDRERRKRLDTIVAAYLMGI